MNKYDGIKIGDRFGRLTICGPQFFVKKKNSRGSCVLFPCLCECGQKRDIEVYKLLCGHTLSCGCLSREKVSERNQAAKMTARYNQVKPGERFGRLTVKSLQHQTDRAGKSRHVFLCLCDCGKEKKIDADSVTKGASKSCGCIQKEVTRKRSTTHGDAPRGKQARLYRIWVAMRARCTDLNSNRYPNYGGRGIYVCDEWQTFGPFKEWALANGYRDDLSIDRIDNDLPYHPDNCRWATSTEQANNKTTTVLIEAWGEEKTIPEWSRDSRCAVNEKALWYRLQVAFWEPEQAISEPPRLSGR